MEVQTARSCCCGVGVSSYTAEGKHHRMSFSSFLKDRRTLGTTMVLCVCFILDPGLLMMVFSVNQVLNLLCKSKTNALSLTVGVIDVKNRSNQSSPDGGLYFCGNKGAPH